MMNKWLRLQAFHPNIFDGKWMRPVRTETGSYFGVQDIDGAAVLSILQSAARAA